MLGNVDPAGEPDAFVRFCICEKFLQPGEFARPPDQPVVQPDREHLGAAVAAFGVKRVEAVFQILIELLARDVAGCGGKTHIIGFERVGDHQLVMVAQFHPIGQVVVVGVGNPRQTLGFRRQPHGVHRAASGVPADRRAADHLFVQAEAFGDLARLFGGVHVAVIDPFQPVAGNLPTGGLHGGDLFGVACQGGGHAIHGDRDRRFDEQAVQAPKTCARAVVVDRFHVPVPHARPRRGTGDVGEERLGLGVAVQKVVLAALFVVQHNGDGDLGPARPCGIRRVWPMTTEIARVAVHRGLPADGETLFVNHERVYQIIPERPMAGARVTQGGALR